jgi:hypothetical protein
MEEGRNHHVLEAADVVVHVDAYWLRHYAGDFLAAARVFELPGTRFSPVPYFLICHSIELSLKSFLFPAGFKKRDRRKLGHDLEAALHTAEECGLGGYLDITSDDREIVRKASKPYSKKEFEYFESLETVYDPLPFELAALLSFAVRLYEAIEGPVKASVFE